MQQFLRAVVALVLVGCVVFFPSCVLLNQYRPQSRNEDDDVGGHDDSNENYARPQFLHAVQAEVVTTPNERAGDIVSIEMRGSDKRFLQAVSANVTPAPNASEGDIISIGMRDDDARVTDNHAATVAAIICPFLSTLFNEGVLAQKCFHHRDELRNITIAAGLDPATVDAHISGNFKNNPTNMQNICDMEGASNEHKTSTGINDCHTIIQGCATNSDGTETCASFTPNKSCGVPDPNKFTEVFDALDVNRDNFLTRAELDGGSSGLPINDANPKGEGTIEGSFGFVLDIFGEGDRIHRVPLRRLMVQRLFPHGYAFGKRGTNNPCGAYGQPLCPTCKRLLTSSSVWQGEGVYRIQPGSTAVQVYCTAVGWTQFMKFGTLGLAFNTNARSNARSHPNDHKLDDAVINDLIEAGEGDLRLECNAVRKDPLFAFVVPRWTRLGFGKWSTYKATSKVDQRFAGFEIPAEYEVSTNTVGGKQSPGEGMVTMTNPGYFGTTSSRKPCWIKGSLPSIHRRRRRYSNFEGFDLAYYVVD